MKILGIESSCDETAAAVVEIDSESGITILSNIVASQIDEHRLYGGVVPEIASRRHCEAISGVCAEALCVADVTANGIDAVAVTYAPGLIGALLVGVNFAKGLAHVYKKPLIPVHHIRGHIAACYLHDAAIKPPFLCLVASGGHSHIVEVVDYTTFRVVGKTVDDAAGEAFDKAARVLGLPYPGGREIEAAAKKVDCGELPALLKKYNLPFPKTEREFDYSFSGLKTAVINAVHRATQKGEVANVAEIAACFQETAALYLTRKTVAAAISLGYKQVALTGGVAANSRVREVLTEHATGQGIAVVYPPVSLCGDNAAMVACQGYFEYKAGNVAEVELNAFATMGIE